MTGSEMEAIQSKIAQYSQLIAKQPQLSEQTVAMHLTLGKLYERAGNTADAIQEFATVALYYADHGQIVRAMAAAQLMVRLDPENEEILDRLGDLYFLRKTIADDQLQEYHESVKQIDEALHRAQQESPSEESEAVSQTQEATPEIIGLLKQVDLFARLSVSELRGIYQHSRLRHFTGNEPILTGGNRERSLFVLLQGSVKIFGKDKKQQNTLLAVLKTGDSFGEFALFGRIDPNLSVIAEDTSSVLEIPRSIVLKLAKNRPYVTQALKELFRRRILDTALAQVPLFSHLAPQDREKILPYFKPVRVQEGTVLVREAEPGDSMYFLLAGEVGVYASLGEADSGDASSSETETVLLATLKRGDLFGEQALVTNEPRSATVIALSGVTLLKFSKEDLAVVMREHPGIESALQLEAYQNQMRKKLVLLKELAPS